MIYLASPYSDLSPIVREHRYLKALEYTHLRLQAGEVIFSPIVYGHPISETYGVPGDANHWWDFNREILCRSTSLRVLMLEGWQHSLGVLKEVQFAEIMALPIDYVSPF